MKNKLPLFAASAAFGLLLCPLSAHADYLHATLGQNLFETSHHVDVKISDGVATMTVQRVFTNAGTIEEEASLDIDLPVEAVATGLRIKAGDTWFSGDLMDRDEAERIYLELTGLGLFAPKDPAILFWERLGVLHLQVFPISPGKSSTVEYTLTVPTEYLGGQYYVSYPKKTNAPNLAEPSFRFFGEEKGVQAFIDGAVIALETNSKTAAAPTAALVLKARTQEIQRAEDSITRVTSKLKVSKKGKLSKATASLNIKHTYRGDLRVVLVAPSGAEQVLFNQQDGGENDLVASYPLTDLLNEAPNGEWRLIVEDHAAIDVGTLKSWKLELEFSGGEKKTFTAKDTPLFLPDVARSDWDGDGGSWLSAGYTRLSASAPQIDTLAGRVGKVDIEGDKDKSLYRVELDTAAQLRPLPKKLSVVFLIDASYSVEEAGIEPQLLLAKSFLSHVPDASVEIVVYRRFAARVFGSFTAATKLDKSLSGAEKAGKFALGNGSAIDEGLKLAAQLLKDRGDNPTMIVALTDTMLRSRFTNKLALDALRDLPKNTFVHVVHRQEGSNDLSDIREDSAPLAPIAAAHGGIFLRIEGEGNTPTTELAPVSLGLVRPIRIDQCKVTFPKKTKEDLWQVPSSFYEGEGLRFMSLESKPPESMVITGKLWQEEVRREFSVSQDFSKKTAAFAFSGDLYSALSEPQQRALAFYGAAVSPVTSYLAIEPGVRPSRAGIERTGESYSLGGGGFGLGGAGIGHGMIGITWTKDIALLAKKGTDACFDKYPKPAGWSASLAVESNYRELIDVLSKQSDPLTDCIVEAVWAVQLNPGFTQQTETFTLSF